MWYIYILIWLWYLWGSGFDGTKVNGAFRCVRTGNRTSKLPWKFQWTTVVILELLELLNGCTEWLLTSTIWISGWFFTRWLQNRTTLVDSRQLRIEQQRPFLSQIWKSMNKPKPSSLPSFSALCNYQITNSLLRFFRTL